MEEASRLSFPWRAIVLGALVLLGALPFLPALFERVAVLAPLAAALDAWFAFQCERDPARMLGVGAVCARCIGIYVGLALGAVFGARRGTPKRVELWLAFSVLALACDVATEALGWRPPWAPLRLTTGLALGSAASVVVASALRSRS